MGPTIKPTEKEMPISAMPFDLFSTDETSATIDVDNETFPLNNPHRVREMQKRINDPDDRHQMM